MVTTRANRGKASIYRGHSIHRSRSSARRQLEFETLRERLLHKKSSDQAFFRSPRASNHKAVVLKLAVKPHQALLDSPEALTKGAKRKRKAVATLRQWAIPKRVAKRQLSTSDPYSPARRPTPIQRQAAHLELLPVPIDLPPRPCNNQPVASKQASCSARSFRRGLTLRLQDHTPAVEQVAREIQKKTNLPRH